jgi:hypothetical protein
MKHILVYVEHASSCEDDHLKKILGMRLQIDSVLPIVSDPIGDERRVQSILVDLSHLRAASAGRMSIIVAPRESEIPGMTKEAAVGMLKSQDAWRDFLQSFEVDAVDVKFCLKEHRWCWVGAAFVSGGGIPPGIGFVIDKCSGSVFLRRFADVHSDLFSAEET